jgi:hypothetical protein
MQSKIKIVKDQWHKFHGKKTKRGALRAKTDTDYMVFTCPQCEIELRGGAGIKLMGASSDLNVEGEGKHALAFLIHCVKCDFRDHFRIALDQFGRYGTGVGLEG